jgi:hypothetical protein
LCDDHFASATPCMPSRHPLCLRHTKEFNQPANSDPQKERRREGRKSRK